MSVDRLFNSPASITSPQQVARDRDGLEGLKAADLAREFESMLMLQMLRQMRHSMIDESEDQTGLSSATMTDIVDTELARQLSRTGGLGIADAMTKALRRQLDVADAVPAADRGVATGGAVSLGNPGVSEYVPVASPAVSLPGQKSGDSVGGLDASRLTSAYGWRADPFTGAAKRHQGVDLRAAYGQSVPAAADGRVVEAAERGAYGLTLLVEHPNGLRTRYAHLSAATVSVGDRVLQGQEIGRVGQSGRATGPHLHFEVIRDGQRIDPTTVIALNGSGLDGLKLAGGVADFPVGGHVHMPATSGDDDED